MYVVPFLSLIIESSISFSIFKSTFVIWTKEFDTNHSNNVVCFFNPAFCIKKVILHVSPIGIMQSYIYDKTSLYYVASIINISFK